MDGLEGVEGVARRGGGDGRLKGFEGCRVWIDVASNDKTEIKQPT